MLTQPAPSLSSVEFDLTGLPKSMNALYGYRHQAKYGEKLRWRKSVQEAIMIHRIRIGSKPLDKVHLTYTRKSSRRPDHDNLVSSFKYIQDALVYCNLIADDAPKVIVMVKYLWEKCLPGAGGVRIKMEWPT